MHTGVANILGVHSFCITKCWKEKSLEILFVSNPASSPSSYTSPASSSSVLIMILIINVSCHIKLVNKPVYVERQQFISGLPDLLISRQTWRFLNVHFTYSVYYTYISQLLIKRVQILPLNPYTLRVYFKRSEILKMLA